MSAPTDAADAGLRLAHALQLDGIPYALGGALALGAHGVPRGTLDVDLNVFVDEAEVPRVIACLKRAGVEVEESAAIAQARRDGMFVGNWAGMRIDVFIPSIPFSHEAGRSRVELRDADGMSVWFLSAEALAVFKLLFNRPKDRADLERLLAIQGASFDRDYTRMWIVDMMGETDERVVFWDDLAARF